MNFIKKKNYDKNEKIPTYFIKDMIKKMIKKKMIKKNDDK